MDAKPLSDDDGKVWRSYVGIPVRSLWTLLVYAADLAQFLDRFDGGIEESADIPELLARLLGTVVERRLHRNLSRSYQAQQKLLTRVRGRIDWLRTASGQHLRQGRVACKFEDLTFDTYRNRLVWTALTLMAATVSQTSVAHNCRRLASDFIKLGVSPIRPSRAQSARDQIGRNDADDRLMMTVAQLALDLIVPSESIGNSQALGLHRDEVLLRRIFEKAVAGFYRHELNQGDGWTIQSQKVLTWSIESPTARLRDFIPSMSADIVLSKLASGRRIVIDTKFSNIITPRQYGGEAFKSANLYQLYAYLRSQADRGDKLADEAEGLLLYPAIDQCIDESALIQNHRIRFATVDLADSPDGIKARLLNLIPDIPPLRR
jgi:5-methylcytosine-specific restriction enzyme subunit McrC